MQHYNRNDIQICIEFSKYSKILEGYFGEDGSDFSSHYDARIVYNNRKSDYIDFIIYYPSSESLYEKFQFLEEQGISILQGIKTKPAGNSWEYPDILDFSNSRLLNIIESNNWEHNKIQVILKIDNLDLLKNYRQTNDGFFQLTENALQHLDEYITYGQLANYDPSDNFIDSDKNREIYFGNILFKLTLKHDYGFSTKFKLVINREAYLSITDDSNKLTDDDLIQQGRLLCTLMSFYWQKTVDSFHSYIRVINKENYQTREQLKYSNHYIDESEDYYLKPQYSTIYEFIESLNYENISNTKNLLYEIIPRINKAKFLDEISEFMLLYNVIEKIRNFCVINPVNGNKLKIKEEFVFVKSKTLTDSVIKNKIKEIVEIVDPIDSEEFLKKASDKVNFIKKTGLIDQFDSLLSYLGLDPLKYDLNYSTLIKIRNEIYHGKPSSTDIKPYNPKMMRIINDMILRLIQ